MDGLFPIEVLTTDIPAIAGLSYHPNYISVADEMRLVAAIDRGVWNETWERRRQLYGGSYGRGDDSAMPIPEWGLDLVARMQGEGLTEKPFNHMLINEYLPGQGIASHRDYEPFDRTVVSLSLLAPCVMDFRQVQGGVQHSLLLEPRSLLILSDNARYDWQHGIARRKNDRWHGSLIPRRRRLSVTFRRRKPDD